MKNHYRTAAIARAFSLFITFIIFSVSNPVEAQLISWNLDGNTGLEASVSPTSFATGIDASAGDELVRGPNLVTPTFPGFPLYDNSFVARNFDQNTEATTLASGNYFQFSITPDASYEMTLTSVEFFLYRFNSNAVENVFITSSLDAHATVIDRAGPFTTTGENAVSLTLPSSFENLSSTVTFRIYMYKAGTIFPSADAGFRTDGVGNDLQVGGFTVPLGGGSAQSIIESVAASEVPFISSLENDSPISTNTDGVQVWQLIFRDGDGVSPDGDALPTIYDAITFNQGAGNDVVDWGTTILEVELFEGSTLIPSNVIINPNSFTIDPSPDLTVPDDGSRTFEIRISLQTNLPPGADQGHLVFEVDHTNTAVGNLASSSQLGSFTETSDAASNEIEVIGTTMSILVQPSDLPTGVIMSPAVEVAFTDANGNVDEVSSVFIELSASGASLSGTTTLFQSTSVDGIATFNDIEFTTGGTGVTLTFTDITDNLGLGNFSIVSNSFTVFNSSNESVIVGAGNEAASISSILNTPTITTSLQGQQVWQFDLYDGDGLTPDNDALPTKYTGWTITQGPGNSITDWSTVLQDVAFFVNGVFIDGTLTINPSSIEFIPDASVDVPDNGTRRIVRMYVSLQTTLPPGIDEEYFVFRLTNSDVIVAPDTESSQLATFVETTDNSGTLNDVEVVATDIQFVQQPTDVDLNIVMTPAVTVAFVDANGNIENVDGNFVTITATGATLSGSATTFASTTAGIATFDNIIFSAGGTGVFLTAEDILGAIGGITIDSDPFDVLADPEVTMTAVGPAPGDIERPFDDFVIYDIEIDVINGNTTLNELTIVTGGTYAATDVDVNGIKLYYSDNDVFEGPGFDVELSAQSSVSGAGETIVFTGLSQTFPANEIGHLFVTVDLSPTAVVYNTISVNATPIVNIIFAESPNQLGADPLVAGGTQTIFEDLFVSSDLTITSSIDYRNVTVNSGTLTIDPGVNLQVKGPNYVNNGIIDGTGATIELLGIASQSLTGSGTTTIDVLTLDNTFGVTNETNWEILETLQLDNGDFNNTLGSVTLVSTSATATADLGPVAASASYTGDLTIQRYLPAVFGNELEGEWFGLASGVQGATLNEWDDDMWLQGLTDRRPGGVDNVYTYSNPLNQFVGATSLSDPVNPGVGFRVFIYNDFFDGSFNGIGPRFDMTGPPVVGDGAGNPGGSFSFNLDRTGSNGLNLVGNPYPSEIDWEAATGWSRNLINNTIWIWNQENYATYTIGGGATNGGSRYIASSQAFWVERLGGAGPILSINEAAKSSTNRTFLRTDDDAQPIVNAIKFRLERGDAHSDEAILAFRQGSLVGADSTHDAVKFLGQDFMNLSFLAEQGTGEYNVFNAVPQVEKSFSVFLHLGIVDFENSDYTLSFSQLESLQEPYELMVIDHFTEETTTIGPEETYAFSIDENNPETYSDDRFEVVVINTVTAIEDEISNKVIAVYPNPNRGYRIKVAHRNADLRGAYLTVFDLSGKQIHSELMETELATDLAIEEYDVNLPAGIYLVVIENSRNRHVEKLFVN